MKKLVLLSFVFLCGLNARSQSTMVKGYVVTDKGDTLKGEVKINPKKEIDNYNKVTFKDESGMQKIYKPKKTLGYGFNDEHYIAMDSQDDEKKFYKVLATGDINFYKYGFEFMRMNAVNFEVEYYVSKAGTKELILIKESKFKKQIADLMEDNAELVDAYGDEKKFDYEKALETITSYNAWKAKQ
jgi:hypothetical protein